MSNNSGTARAMVAIAEQSLGYTLGKQTREHIASFVDAMADSATMSQQCLVEALAVAEGFPKWERKSAAYKALGQGVSKALIDSGMTKGSAQGYATHFSNIVRVAKLPKIEYAIGKRKDGSSIVRHCDGKAFFLEHCGSFFEAYRAAKVLAKEHGLTSGAGRTSTIKALDKASIIDLLDKVISAARVTIGFGDGFLPALQKARTLATGKVLLGEVKITRMRGYASLSRGQKAAATRRANQTKVARAVEQANVSTMH